jgi:hypothetical protein
MQEGKTHGEVEMGRAPEERAAQEAWRLFHQGRTSLRDEMRWL